MKNEIRRRFNSLNIIAVVSVGIAEISGVGRVGRVISLIIATEYHSILSKRGLVKTKGGLLACVASVPI